MNAQDLKDSILQLAIQGKLVEQRVEEGTAEELYKQIQAGNQVLIQEGKIKKKNKMKSITEEEKWFDIPNSWMWLKLENVGEWGAGSTPLRSNPAYYGGDIPWLKTGDLTDGYINEVPEYITEKALKETSVKLNPVGSVLMAMYGATIGKLGILNIEATTNQACCACIPYNGIYNKYLFYYLMAQRRNFIKMGAGGAQPNISRTKIINFTFPLPPLNEQKRIVAKIEELMPYVDQYGEAYETVTELNKQFPKEMEKSILQYAIQGKLVEQRVEEGTAEELFEQIQEEKQQLIEDGMIRKQQKLPEITEEEILFEIPATWKWIRLGNIGEWGAGATPLRSNPMYYGGNIAWLKTGDLNDGYIDSVPEHITDKALNETSVKLNPVGSVLMAMYGATIGKLGILNIEATTNQACCACVPFQGVYNKYLFYYLMAQRSNFINMGSGGAQPNISRTKIVNYIIPLPPLEEQKRIVAKVEETFAYVKYLIR